MQSGASLAEEADKMVARAMEKLIPAIAEASVQSRGLSLGNLTFLQADIILALGYTLDE